MKIAKPWARGFWSLRDVTLEGLGAFQVFFGHDGSGKIRLLAATGTLFRLLPLAVGPFSGSGMGPGPWGSPSGGGSEMDRDVILRLSLAATLLTLGCRALPEGDRRDAGTVIDTGSPSDTVAPAETGSTPDTGIAPDTGSAIDTGSGVDTGIPTDAGSALDSGITTDTGRASDTGAFTDRGGTMDTGSVLDSGLTDADVPDSGMACPTGYGNCDGLTTNGCETDLRSTAAHCGRCGNACPTRPNTATNTCAAGSCTFTCVAGFHRVGEACVADGGVRPIRPMPLGDTSLRRPTLRFALPTGADGAVIELCRDRACTVVIETLRVTGTTARPGAPLPASRVVFWRARARVGATEDTATANGPTWLFHTPATDTSSGIDTSYNPHLDVNGDGFDDVAVGARLADRGSGIGTGTASVFRGTSSGVSPTAARVFEGATTRDEFGFSVASAGRVAGSSARGGWS